MVLCSNPVSNPVRRLGSDRDIVFGTVGRPDAGKQEPEIIIDLGGRPHRRAGIF